MLQPWLALAKASIYQYYLLVHLTHNKLLQPKQVADSTLDFTLRCCGITLCGTGT